MGCLGTYEHWQPNFTTLQESCSVTLKYLVVCTRLLYLKSVFNLSYCKTALISSDRMLWYIISAKTRANNLSPMFHLRLKKRETMLFSHSFFCLCRRRVSLASVLSHIQLCQTLTSLFCHEEKNITSPNCTVTNQIQNTVPSVVLSPLHHSEFTGSIDLSNLGVVSLENKPHGSYMKKNCWSFSSHLAD